MKFYEVIIKAHVNEIFSRNNITDYLSTLSPFVKVK